MYFAYCRLCNISYFGFSFYLVMVFNQSPFAVALSIAVIITISIIHNFSMAMITIVVIFLLKAVLG